MEKSLEKNRVMSLFKISIGYLSISLLNALLPFLLLPVITHYLSSEEYGVVAFFQAMLQFCIPLVGGGVAGVISIKFFQSNREQLKTYIYNGFILISLITIMVTLIIYGLSCFLIKLPFSQIYILNLPLVAASISILAVYSALLQMEERLWQFGFINIGVVVFESVFTVFFIFGLSRKGVGRIDAIVLANLFCMFVILFLMKKENWFVIKISKKRIIELIKIGGPIIIYQVGFLVILLTDRILLSALVDLSSVGIYMVGLQIAMVISLIESAAIKAWVPWLFTQLSQDDLSFQQIIKYKSFYILLLISITTFFVFLSPLIVKLMVTEEYYSAVKVIPWLAYGFMFMGFYKIFAQYSFYKQVTRSLMWIGLITASINIPVSYILISQNGMIGAAQATLLCYFLAFLMSFGLSQKQYEFNYTSYFIDFIKKYYYQFNFFL